MAIDGIGRKGPPLPAPPEGAAPSKGAERAPRAFEVGRAAGAAAPVSPAAVTAPTALEQLRAGAITPHEYVELKVQQATSHLTMLSPAELESVRNALRDRITGDPSLSELVYAATGSLLEPPGDR
jgi:hypothetical protein